MAANGLREQWLSQCVNVACNMLLSCRAAEVVVSAKKGRLDPIFQRHFDASFKNVKQEFDKDQQEVGHKKAHATSHKTFTGLLGAASRERHQ